MTHLVTSARKLVAESSPANVDVQVELLLFDEPLYNRDWLDLGASTGRKRDDASDAKGLAVLPACAQQLESLYPHSRVICTPSFPLGWSATVPLKAVVIDPGGVSSKLFVKYCDPHEGILNQVKKEFIWQQALWAKGVRIAPKPVLFDYNRRLFISQQAEGVPAPKRIFDESFYRDQIAEGLAHIHSLDIRELPGDTYLFLRPVQKAIDEGLKKRHLDSRTVRNISLYAPALEVAVGQRYDPSTMLGAVHGDMKAGNVLLRLKDRALTITDFGLAHRGDPASDIGFFFADVHRPIDEIDLFVEHYLSFQQGDPKFLERVSLHTAYNRLERYIRTQQRLSESIEMKNTMAAFVKQDFLKIKELLTER